MFRSLSTTLLWRGLLAVAVGIIAIAWPDVTVGAVVFIFAVAAFVDAGIQAVRGFSSDGAGPVAGHLLLALLDVVAGVVAIAWPGITALALAIWIAVWAVIAGAAEFPLAFAFPETAGQRALYGLTGVLSVLLGVVLFARPDVGAVSLAQVFGFFALATGLSSLVLAASTHHAGTQIDTALR